MSKDSWEGVFYEACAEAGVNLEDETAIKSAMHVSIREMGGVLREGLNKGSRRMRCDREALRRGFERRLARRWSRPVHLLTETRVVATELGDEINREHRPLAAAEQDYVFEALTRLHGRGCQTAGEVECLIRGGFATAAHSRWRTLHELSIVALFIRKHGRDTAERYLLHDRIESYRIAAQYLEYQDQLNVAPVSEAEVASLREVRDHLRARFGREYEQQYGWAANDLKQKRPTFADLEASIGMRHWRPYFKMASHGVHAGPKGLSFRLETAVGGQGLILTGPSNTGFADPGHGTALSLLHLTTALVVEFPTLDRLVAMEALDRIVEEAGDAFLAVQKRVEADTRERWLRRRVEYWLDYARVWLADVVG